MADIEDQAIEVFEDAAFRCCTRAEFVVWFVGIGQLRDHTGRVWDRACLPPPTARTFCLECHPLAQQEMAAQGRCMRMDTAHPEGRERMRRYRERQRCLAT